MKLLIIAFLIIGGAVETTYHLTHPTVELSVESPFKNWFKTQ